MNLRVDLPQTVQRVLAGGQVHETAGFFGLPGERLFGVTHLPAGAIHGGLVICSSIGPEQLTSYRNEVVLARRLAAAGVAVQRFHYRGSGHSDGEDVDLTLGTMVEDAAAAAARLAEVTAVHHPSFLGTRWGALVATRAASLAAGAPLVVWEPVADPARAFRELFRTQASHELKIGTPGRRTSEMMLAELEANGQVDILGYALQRGFYQSAIRAALADGLSGRQRLLVVRLGRTVGAEAGLADFTAAAEAAGCAVEVISLEQAPVWHFVDHSAGWGAVLVERTTQWLLAATAAEAAGRGAS